jgi:hypothetical protein
MPHPSTTHSHPICPTCQSDLTGRDVLDRFAGDGREPLASDSLSGFYEETAQLVGFLGAVAQAGPLAAAQEESTSPEWLEDFIWLAEELTGETKRRLQLLDKAGGIWRRRAEGKEG